MKGCIANEKKDLKLYQAVRAGDRDKVWGIVREKRAWFWPASVDVNVPFGFGVVGNTAVHEAVDGVKRNARLRDDSMEILRMILRVDGADLNKREGYAGRTPLHFATNIDALRALVEAGANPNLADGQGATPLHDQVNSSREDMVRVLLMAGADVNFPADRRKTSGVSYEYYLRLGQTPLFCAKSADMVRLLLEAGANPNAHDHQGCNPVHYAQSREVVQALLDGGADPNVTYDKGAFPTRSLDMGSYVAFSSSPSWAVPALRYHVQSKHDEIVRALLATGIDPNGRDFKGQTPLHYYAQRQRSGSILQALLQAGANINATDKVGLAPLQLARNTHTVKSLLKAGAVPSVVEYREVLLRACANTENGDAWDTLRLIMHQSDHELWTYGSLGADLHLLWTIADDGDRFWIENLHEGDTPFDATRQRLSQWPWDDRTDTTSPEQRKKEGLHKFLKEYAKLLARDEGDNALHAALKISHGAQLTRNKRFQRKRFVRRSRGSREWRYCLPVGKLLEEEVQFLIESIVAIQPRSPYYCNDRGELPLQVAAERLLPVSALYSMLRSYPDLVMLLVDNK